MPLTMEFTDTLVVTTCWCGINYAVPEDLKDYQQRQHRDGIKPIGIYCPLGHSSIPAGESKAEKLEQQLERERALAGRLAAQRDQAEAQARGQKAAATRARNERDRLGKRAKAGVCPCCNRSFRQLRRHMASQHPDFDATAETAP